ncbi:SAVMC3_10250 family protein [Streptomyces violaceusniger]|uniref:SAVMC3_10250 family protein n=1 Tax=Streptomyces violaceusniger TaxID=68280 RepID=UPI0010F67A92
MLYFSEAKSQQFVSGSRLRSSIKELSAEISISFASAKLSAVADAGDARAIPRGADKLIRHIEESALWFEDPTVTHGDWVQFETRLAQVLVWVGDLRMLFFGPHPESTGDVALLLYGSPKHLTMPPGVRAGVEVQDLDSAHESLVAMIQAAAVEDSEPHLRGAPGFRDGVIKMAERVQQHSMSFPAMFGCAQVVGTFDCANRVFLPVHDGSRRPSRLVVASPLIVECL